MVEGTYRFVGAQPGYKGAHGKTKGIMYAHKQQKRKEAELRDELLPQDSPKRKVNQGLDNKPASVVQ